MSMRARINGFTAWINLRLMPYNLLMNNVLMDLLQGTNLKSLIESMTGIDNKKIQSFDGLTNQQKVTRIEWIVAELKQHEVIPDDIYVDCRMFAVRQADQVFDLLWDLVTHDIWFTWDRFEYLLQTDVALLSEVPFKWTPAAPPPKKKKKTKQKQSLLTGFGSTSVVTEVLSNSPEPRATSAGSYEKWPGAEKAASFKSRKSWVKPAPEDCILEMINVQLKTVREGKRLNLEGLEDMVDSRVLCALVNSFAPGTFTTEIMINDRWSINLALRTYEKIMRIETKITSEELAEADVMGMNTYMCVYFMCGFKLKQSKAVLQRSKDLVQLIREAKHELEGFPAMIGNMAMLKRKKEVKASLERYETETAFIKKNYDLEECQKWWEHVEQVQKETREIVAEKIKQRFDVIEVPRFVSINDLCLNLVINLSLTGGSGFYLSKNKETVNNDRRMVLRDLKTGKFIDDFSQGKGKKAAVSVRKLLGLPPSLMVEVNPTDYPQYEIYFESLSRNKKLKPGTMFLYQVFPGNTIQWEILLFKASKQGELDTVDKLVTFFKDKKPGFINSKEIRTGNTSLHWAARNGHYMLVLYLLEHGANLDAKNVLGATPFFCAVEGLHKGISQIFRVAMGDVGIYSSGSTNAAQAVSQLLVEWGANVYMQNHQSKTAFDVVKNDEMKDFLIDYYEHLNGVVPKLMQGNMELLQQLVSDHFTGVRTFANLRSRCVNGSTLIHTAAYFGSADVIRELLVQRVEVDLLDYKGATPLHRARDVEIIELLLENEANIDAEDSEGNTPLHVKCYGESNQPSEIDCMQLLLTRGALITQRNSKELLPIHCAAMQGRVDSMELLLAADVDGQMRASLGAESPHSPPSLVHLSIANDFLDCAYWLVDNGFGFKENEQNLLVYRILTEQIKSKRRLEILNFLFDHDADLYQRFTGANTVLHYAAGISGPTDILEMLLERGADVHALNADQCTCLFFATQVNNLIAASIIIEHGVNVRQKNVQGLTALDLILDFDEWISSDFFSDQVKARLKAYSLKHTRDLIRAISSKVKSSAANSTAMAVPKTPANGAGLPPMSGLIPPGSAYTMMWPAHSGSFPKGSRLSLPPVPTKSASLGY